MARIMLFALLTYARSAPSPLGAVFQVKRMLAGRCARGGIKTMIKIFYSWQSDLDDFTNRKAISLELQAAKLQLERELNDSSFLIEEATSNLSGSPNIPEAIALKIQQCDIFIADITTINGTSEGVRKVANPNVLIELGQAISLIGWDRIILLYNKAYGNFPDDIPFDIDRHRVLDYKVIDKNDKSGCGNLRKALFDAIKLIHEKNPPKRSNNNQASIEERKRNNDLNILRILLKNIYLPLFDEFIDQLPDRIDNQIFYFYEGFSGLVKSSYFFVYDEELRDKIVKFNQLWNFVLSFGHCYRYEGRLERHIFMQGPYNEQTEKDYKSINSKRKPLYDSYRDLINYVRVNYIEIDLIEMSDKAICEYSEYMADFAERLKQKD